MSRTWKTSLFAFSLSALLFSSVPAAFSTTQSDPQTKPPDNTGVNKRDRNPDVPTAGSQKENQADRETTRQIRRAITKDKSLSTYSRNVKVITQNGMVTLRGPVPSETAKEQIEAKAVAIAGKDKVKNELEISSKRAATPTKRNKKSSY